MPEVIVLSGRDSLCLRLLVVVIGQRCEQRSHVLGIKVGPGWVHGLAAPERTPDSAVALEAGAKAHLPDAVAALDAADALDEREDVPEGMKRARGGWARAVDQGGLRRFHADPM